MIQIEEQALIRVSKVLIMAGPQDKAIKFGSVVTLLQEASKRKMVISDGFVDTTLHFMKPRKTSSQSLIRGLFIILPPMTNEVKVCHAFFLPLLNQETFLHKNRGLLRIKIYSVCLIFEAS
jgi:hypothetical protein